MKKLFIILIVILTASILASCANSASNANGGKEETTTANNPGTTLTIGEDALNFTVGENNVKITPNLEAKPVIEALGEPLEYIESPSCGFEGMDKTYKYNGFVIDTVTLSGTEFIYVVQITNDLVTTPEGVYVGMSADDIKAIYKDKFSIVNNNVMVEFTNGIMTCFIKNGVCTNITYESTTIPNLQVNEK